MSKHAVIVGRAENIDLSNVALNIPAKIDTGAFRSSIHVSSAAVVNRQGKEVLVCELLGHPSSPVGRPYETEKFSVLPIKNSTGQVETRFEIDLRVKIGPKVFTTSFSLSDRSNNIYPILIGRKALKNRFLVDVAETAVNRMDLKQLKGIVTPEDEEDLE